MGAYPQVDQTYLTLARRLAEAGLVCLHLMDHAGLDSTVVPQTFQQALRQAWPRAFIIGSSLDRALVQQAVADGLTDLVGMVRNFLANPDLVERFKKGRPLTPPDFNTFFIPGEKGYTDNPVVGA